MTVRVVIADDQHLVRTGLRMILSAEDGIEVVGEAADGAEAIDVCASARPDVVLMDVRMPGVDGIDATRAITAEPAAAARCWCSPPSTSTTSSTTRCAPAPAGSCSRTRPRSGSPPRSGSSPRAARCSPRR